MSAGSRKLSGFFARCGAALLPLALAACVPSEPVSRGPASDFIIVSDFAAPEGVVRLDPSFGFSLYRGEAGVPKDRRAASIGRAVSFLVTDTVTGRLRGLGYDAVSTTNPNATAPNYRALIVSGSFSTIDEGQRRHVGDEHSAVIVTVDIKAQSVGGGLQKLQSFAVDSRSAPATRAGSAATTRETGIDADATRVGAEIARIVAEIARRNNWVPATR